MQYETEFLTNYTDKRFLDKIKESILNCKSFHFSVSFIKLAGLKLIIDEIETALKRGVVGKLITSTYQNFTDIPSLEKFLELSQKYQNFSCKIDYKTFSNIGFHSKGYLFEYGDYYEVIVGSSNITRYALLKNIEWNISLFSKEREDIYIHVINEFNYLWEKTDELTKEVIVQYTKQLEYVTEKWDMDFDPIVGLITPNYMQIKALKEIRRYRDMAVDKALVIAATGSGKTYLAAFDAKIFDAKRLLFIVHRDTIINEAIKTFRKVFGEAVSYGKMIGDFKEIDKDFIFASNILLSKNLVLFNKDEFDYIIIDEVHHAVASTYQNILEYFQPRFLLGLTATPERMDNESIFDIFKNNVPYELRLRDALINDLIVPFKYYGIKDQFVDYSEINARKLIQELSSNVRAEFIADKIGEYKPSGQKLKAIGFCRNIDHAKLMSDNMTFLGYPSTYLYGKNNTRERMDAFYRLQDDKNPLQIIFTIDILNEGVDLPQVNMVLFLRPTESSTVFIQQLGRGLRKYPDKEYLTVLDFIGNNYKRSVQIALALSTLAQDVYVDKSFLIASIMNDFTNLDLPIEINIDEKSKEEILKQIESTNFNSLVFLGQDYSNFKTYLNGEIPKHMDYFNVDSSPDILRFIKTKGSYYEFLIKLENDTPTFIKKERDFIKYLSSFLPLIRKEEFMIIGSLMERNNQNYDELLRSIKDETNNFSLRAFEHALSFLQNKFYSEKEQALKEQYVSSIDDKINLNISFNNELFKDFINDLLEYGLKRFEKEFSNCETNLKVHTHYSRIQFLQAIYANTMTFREGIKYYENELYLFIDLKKDQSKDEWLLYNDKFINASLLQWESSTSTTLLNKTGTDLIMQKYCHLFVRKIKKEDGITLPYIYIGKGELTNPRPSQNTKLSLLFDIILNHEIPEYLKFDFGI